METQLPEGLVGEKLAELEKGNYTTPIKEDIPLSPPKFITQVSFDKCKISWRTHINLNLGAD
jgi:hypothetical protein